METIEVVVKENGKISRHNLPATSISQEELNKLPFEYPIGAKDDISAHDNCIVIWAVNHS